MPAADAPCALRVPPLADRLFDNLPSSLLVCPRADSAILIPGTREGDHMSQIPPMAPGQMGMMRPHRGTLVLVLGILGLVVCGICGIIAWVMGSGDLKEMDAGRMDPTGRGMTQAGKICGMIAVILNCIVIVFYMLIMILAVVAGGAAAAGGGAGNP